MKLVLLGAPGAGKGTLAADLVEVLKIPTISTGDLLRENIKRGTEVGKQAATYINSGRLVPTPIVVKLLENRLKEKDTKNGYILDGFPRTIEQAELLSKITKIDACIYLEVEKSVIVDRIGGRLVCRKCGKVSHKRWTTSKFCECGGEYYTREDDNPETVAKRFDTFEAQTAPLIDYYKKRGLLKVVKGQKEKEDTLKLALEILK